MRSSTIPTFAAFTLVRNSASSAFFDFVKPCTSGLDYDKQKSDQLFGNGSCFMALSQRLEFRQSQSLVMTPQLMQAIKLLQLSNLDLAAFVEDELERNPLLERANDGTEPPVRGEPQPERAEFSDRDDVGSSFEPGSSPDGGPGDRSETISGSGGDAFEPGQEEWLNRDLGSRAEIEQTLDTGLDNVFSEEPAEAAARTAQ